MELSGASGHCYWYKYQPGEPRVLELFLTNLLTESLFDTEFYIF